MKLGLSIGYSGAELKLPKYESWPGYEAALPFVLRRYCGLWGRGT